MSSLSDEKLQDMLITLLVKDRKFLKQVSTFITPKDFHSKEDRTRRIFSKIALDYFVKYREPVGGMLTSEVSEYCQQTRTSGKLKQALTDYAEQVLKKKPIAASSITDRVIRFKKEQLKKSAVDELIELQSSGDLTDEKWLQIANDAVKVFSKNKFKIVDLFSAKEIKGRVLRRTKAGDVRFPVLFIDDFDSQVRAIARGHLGLVIAPFKRGKSLLLIWIALAYTLQGFNVMYITLEDPLDDVEDRYDSCVSRVPIKNLREKPKTFKARFQQFKRLLRSRLKIVDASESGISNAEIQALLDQERDAGNPIDALIVDYDEYVTPEKTYRDNRRMEFDDVYRGFKTIRTKNQLFMWTAAQTKRSTSDQKIINGDDTAEDISKIRKASVVIGVGKGDWTDEGLYLHVAAHRYDRKFVGCNIVPDLERMLIYDREKTMEEKAKSKEKVQQ